jgi:hypothetical protein
VSGRERSRATNREMRAFVVAAAVNLPPVAPP